jgi:uncharacterized membrane protein YraQ (UPF0718 family)
VSSFGALFIYGMAATFGGIALYKREHYFRAGARRALEQMVLLMPRMIVALVAAGFAVQMVPSEVIARYLGADAGFTAVLVASVAAIVVPSGPVIAFAIAAALAGEGASLPALIAFVSGWSVFAAHRIMIFELPMLGGRFVLLRLLSVTPLPVLAGTITLLAQRLLQHMQNP